MTQATLVKDLFVRPKAVRKGDFVLKLSEGVERPAETIDTYVVTAAIADALDQALGLVGSALDDGRSKGAYVHGSFGSGKSHFMAMLSLLLRNDARAWRVAELHPLREKHRFVESAKLLELHFHMIDKDSLEAALFETYVQHVREMHPEAPIPALFADEQVFEDARRMLERMGDAAFLAELGGGTGKAEADAWGDFAVTGSWDRARFERSASSSDPKERRELFDALVKSWFQHATSTRSFVDMDSGLAEIARHAAALEYTGVVLFLDELILWLSHRATEHAWLHAQVQKMVKLVEAQEASREIPIVSFLARQRDLAEMVGTDYAGLETANLRASLEHWSGRFDTIKLEDRNLPAIVERRVLHPVEGAKELIDQAFEQLKRTAGPAWNTLLGEADQVAFRKLYPFSPALVEALVGLSSFLQRERTAIRLLMELLVEHIEDLKVGEVVRVGDLFDALADGTDAADGNMRARFASARELYHHKLLPMLQQQHGTTTAVRCQRERDNHPVRLGCANCPESQCRTDNRLLKTLLIAALVPEIRALKELTATRLVALNHGSIRVPIPGTEAQQVAQKLKKWQSQLSQILVGTQSDPQVRLQLEGVDLSDILKRASDLDSLPARQGILRDLLFESLNVDAVKDIGKEHKVTWRATERRGQLIFANVRKFSIDQLRCPEEHDFRFIVDYPFDEPGFGPQDDAQLLDDVLEKGGAGWTLVWLPSFFSASTNDLLRELTILDRILESQLNVHRYTSHLAVDQQTRVRTDLENLRNAKRSRLAHILDEAYGLSRPNDEDLDPGLSLERHVFLLQPGARIQPQQPSSLSNALDCYLPALLESRYPRHPRFDKPLTKKRVEELAGGFARLVDTDDKQLGLERGILDEWRGVLEQLGMVRITERAAFLAESGLLHVLENRRRQQGLDAPSVGEVRLWIDEGHRMGLTAEAEDLILRCYARMVARTFVQYGRPFEPKAGTTIPDDVVLEQPPLPSQDDWHRALGLVAAAFGESLQGKALHAENLKRFDQAVALAVTKVRTGAARLPTALDEWLATVRVQRASDRLLTARSAAALCEQLPGKSGKELVELLAAFVPHTSAKAVGASLRESIATVRALDNDLVRDVFERLRAATTLEGADELLDKLGDALAQDELLLGLTARLESLTQEARVLLKPAEPERPGKLVRDVRFTGMNREGALEALRSIVADLQNAPNATITGKIELRDGKT
jgi:hypothetical protein